VIDYLVFYIKNKFVLIGFLHQGLDHTYSMQNNKSTCPTSIYLKMEKETR